MNKNRNKSDLIRIGCSIPIGVAFCIIVCLIARVCNVPTLAIELFIILPFCIILIIALMLIYGIIFDKGKDEPFI